MVTVELRNHTASLGLFSGAFFLSLSQGIQRSILGEPSLDTLKVVHSLSINVDFKVSIAIILRVNLYLFACNGELLKTPTISQCSN